MKFIPILPLLCLAFFTYGQSVTGKWKTIDDDSGKAKSIVEIYQSDDGSMYGKILEVYPDPGEDPDPVCTECDEDDPRHGQKMRGMVIMRSLEKDGKYFADGDILDPENGNVYRCKIWAEGDDKLMVRGYLGPFYRTQEWLRVK